LARQQCQQDKRPGVPQFILLITDGKQTGDGDAVASARSCQAAGITVYSVGVSKNCDATTLMNVAGSPARAALVGANMSASKAWATLPSVSQAVQTAACNAAANQ